MKAIRNISILIFAFLAASSYGQSLTVKANECYKEKDYACAQTYIDSAIVSMERFNSQTWQLRGLVYLKLETPENKDVRNISIESFVQARNLDSTGLYSDQINNFLRNAIIRYFNDAVIAIDNGLPEQSEQSYITYKGKYKKYIDPNYDFNSSDVEYYSALGGLYMKQAATKPEPARTKLLAKGAHFYEKVLSIDDNLFQPNFNLGITYYNLGADLIMNMDPFTPIDSIPVIEHRAQDLFRKAVPFLLKAHDLDSKRTEVIEALTGCYYGLQDNENYLKYQTILDKKNLPILEEQIVKEPTDLKVLNELCRIYSTTIKDPQKYKKYLEMLEKAEREE